MTPPVSSVNATDAQIDRQTLARWAAAGRQVQSCFSPAQETGARTVLLGVVPQQRG